MSKSVLYLWHTVGRLPVETKLIELAGASFCSHIGNQRNKHSVFYSVSI